MAVRVPEHSVDWCEREAANDWYYSRWSSTRLYAMVMGQQWAAPTPLPSLPVDFGVFGCHLHCTGLRDNDGLARRL